MLDKQFLDELTNRIAQLMPRATELGEDMRASLKQLLQSSFGKLNILTREEFEAQMDALSRAEQRIAVLERQMQALEKQLAERTTASP